MSVRDGRLLADVPVSDDTLAMLAMLVFLVVAAGSIAVALVTS
jgi:hypothetical protein